LCLIVSGPTGETTIAEVKGTVYLEVGLPEGDEHVIQFSNVAFVENLVNKLLSIQEMAMVGGKEILFKDNWCQVLTEGSVRLTPQAQMSRMNLGRTSIHY